MSTETARPLVPSEPIPEHNHPVELPGFLQKRWVQNFMPWVTSLVMHMVIVLIAAMMVVVVITPAERLHQAQTVIPDPVKVLSNPGGVPNVGSAPDALQAVNDSGGGDDASPGPSVDAAGGASADFALATTSPGGRPGNPFPNIGPGSGGKGHGAGLIGLPGSGPSGPRGPIFGRGGNARNIVFICDASGSMTNKFATLKEQLTRTINKLHPTQTFDIIFFHDGKAVSFARDFVHQDSLVLAKSDTKRSVQTFLDNVAIGAGSDPFEALRLGFARKPDLLYLLTDGDFDDNDAVRAKVASLNQPHANGAKTKVNTIAFLNDNETNVSIRDALQKIASEQQGSFTEVTESQIE